MNGDQTSTAERFEGPLETSTFPDKLSARVVTPGQQPLVHGYDAEADLAPHYDFVSVFLLYLTGELPTAAAAAAARVALTFISPVSVAHASVHGAVLARLCGGPPSSIFGVAAVGLAEQARFELAACVELLAWLAQPTRPFPDAQRATSAADRGESQRLQAALPPGYHLPVMAHNPSRLALVLAILFDAGLRRTEQFEATLAFARLPSALAEAFAERPTNFADYPIHLPPIVYCAPDVQR